jgi:hypothetical protein
LPVSHASGLDGQAPGNWLVEAYTIAVSPGKKKEQVWAPWSGLTMRLSPPSSRIVQILSQA